MILLTKRILLTVAYDGTGYKGWQLQKDKKIITVQGELEKACKILFKQEIECVGASRTDGGVHALGQKVTIDVDTSIPDTKIPIALNSFLPEDIVVVEAKEVSGKFHPRKCKQKKTYEYKIYNNRLKNPLLVKYTEFVCEKLDIINMIEASKCFLGTHDFKSFCATGSSVKTTVRTIYDINIIKTDDNIVKIFITGNGFLYNMVRIIVGTLIGVGKGKIRPEQIMEIIEKKDRIYAGMTAGSQGLTLVNIEYLGDDCD